MLHHPATIPDPIRFEPRHFFEDVLGSILLARSDVAKRLGGSCVFCLSGDDACRWRIDLDAARVSETDSLAADLVVTLDSRALENLMRHSTAKGDDIELVGDRLMLMKVALLLDRLET